MPRITWDDTGTRLFHVGVDRGMLYVGADQGVAWNGLVSVSESSANNDPQPYYIDGEKVLNIPAEETFQAVIVCFSTPEEFAPCTGWLQMGLGLFAADQPREQFGCSYRTKIGNDSAGTEFAYKIHVVYNAIANMSDYTHTTASDSPDPATYSWTINTVPVAAPGVRPTAHVVVDSRLISSDNLAAIENMLYGDEDDDPHLPALSELIPLLVP